ncbi:putative zinc ribbon protein [Enterobacter cloacae]|uniref:putative zinc ribbon protein n=1 Tax=Enterobacter cloacae TaxID=550 RepID=UPI0032DA392E
MRTTVDSGIPPALLLTASRARISAFDQAVNALMERDDVSITAPSDRDYFCILCQREYYGIRCCPACGQHIYSTEMKDLDTLTIPVKFAK